jgi:predicted nucleic acid-binding protein
MEVKQFLLDTNTMVDYVGDLLPRASIAWLDSVVDSAVAISVINQIEVLGFNPPNASTDLIPLEELVETVAICPLDLDVVQRTIALRKAHKIKLPDAIVAATAIAYELVLGTCKQ